LSKDFEDKPVIRPYSVVLKLFGTLYTGDRSAAEQGYFWELKIWGGVARRQLMGGGRWCKHAQIANLH